MSEDFEERVISVFQRLLPIITSVVLMLLSYLPVNFSILTIVRPDLALACIYFWMLHRPDLFGLTSIVVLGIVDGAVSSAVPPTVAYLV